LTVTSALSPPVAPASSSSTRVRSPCYFEYDQTGFRATLRTDSALLDSDAAVRFVGGTA
jgi:hypothetical protein